MTANAAEMLADLGFTPRLSSPLASTPASAQAIARVNYSHDAMIDAILAEPGIQHNKLAAIFGYSVGWVSQVCNSDAFQVRLAARKADLTDPQLILTIDEKLKALASKSLDVLSEKLAAVPSFDQALAVLQTSSKALGYGARQQNLNIQQNFVVALPQKSESSDSWAAANRPMGLPPQPVTIVDPE